MRTETFIFINLCFFLAGCVKNLPPPPLPEKIVPKLPDMPPGEPGKGRVIFDAVDGPARVELVTGFRRTTATADTVTAYGISVFTEVLCNTPCFADLPYGTRDIKFVQQSTGREELWLVEFRKKPSVYRLDFGYYKDSFVPVISWAIGAGLGLTMMITGILIAATGDDIINPDIGFGLLGGGAGTLLLGGVIGYAYRSESQPGSAVQFDLSE